MGAKTQAAVALAQSWVIASPSLWFSFNVENDPVHWRHGHAEAIRVKSLFTLPFQPLVGQALSQAERSGRVPTRVLGRYTLWVSGLGS